MNSDDHTIASSQPLPDNYFLFPKRRLSTSIPFKRNTDNRNLMPISEVNLLSAFQYAHLRLAASLFTTTTYCSYGVDQQPHPPPFQTHNRSHSQVKTENATPLLSTSILLGPPVILTLLAITRHPMLWKLSGPHNRMAPSFLSSAAPSPPLLIVLRNTFHVDF